MMEKCALIITEKPDAASRIAVALDNEGKPTRFFVNGVPCYEVHRDRKIVVVPALGHLYTVAAKTKDSQIFPILDYEWVPRHKAERGASRVKPFLRAIAHLAREADTFIDACDYDIEGSIIGYCILKYACDGKERVAQRMKYSTLTDEELKASYCAPLQHLDFGLVDAGLARHEIDWLYGVNISRALTRAVKKACGSYTMLSTGRVQGPTLGFLASRERSITSHIPKLYWTVKAALKINGQSLEARHEKVTFETKEDAELVAQKCAGKIGQVVSVESCQVSLPPPPPFDLSSLQAEAYRLFGYAPLKTSAVAQRLYLNALISYPRTSSQRLPESIGYGKILENLTKTHEHAANAAELLANASLKPLEGKKRDSAHPAIYPTGNNPPNPLVGEEKNIFNLVVRRFMAVFAEPSLRQTVNATIDINGENFPLKGSCTIRKGWMRIYEPFVRIQDACLPALKRGDSVLAKKVAVNGESTKPPARYTPASILQKMEQGNIGTKATRAGIIQTLYSRKYISEEHISVTNLGFGVTDVLRRYCPAVVSVEFTRQLEEKMYRLQEGRATKAQILEEAIEALKLVASSLMENEKAIGEQLSSALTQVTLQERIIGVCPTCKKGNLIIQYSKKTGKRFVGCTGFFSGTCKTAFPLPQTGNIKPKGRECESCGWPTVQVWRNKRSWSVCFNTECPLKKKKHLAVPRL
jgi:DNA topoisomerase-1